jgi:hypothetical protein
MKDLWFDGEMSNARDEVLPEDPVSPIPGDPFPWEPDFRGKRISKKRGPKFGTSTPSPADPADLDSFDLGGGD